MRLTLDWDDEETKNNNLEAVVNRESITGPADYTLKRSAGGEGYHYIEYNAAGSWPEVTALRDKYGDDRKRLQLDLLRQRQDSPFLQVLFEAKYLDRFAEGGDLGSAAGRRTTIQSAQIAKETKVAGRINYRAALQVLVGTQDDMSPQQISRRINRFKTYNSLSGGKSVSTINAYLRGYRPVTSEAVQRYVLRAIRNRQLGHFSAAGDKPRRRSYVEYLDIVYSDEPPSVDIEESEKDYLLCQVETGVVNDNISDSFHKDIHDDVANYVLKVLSPFSPITKTTLGHNRRNEQAVNPVSRQIDSLNYESEPIDRDELRFYLANMPTPANYDPENYIFFEVWLFDENEGVEWQVLGRHTGDRIESATILKDTNGWW